MSDYDYLCGDNTNSPPSHCIQVCLKTIFLVSTTKTWQILADSVALGLAMFLALAFLLAATRYRLWHSNSIFIIFLGIVKRPLFIWFGNAAYLAFQFPYNNEFYVVWVVLLFAGFGSLFAIIGSTTYTTDKEKLMLTNEKMQMYNSVNVLVIIVLYYLLYDHGRQHSDTFMISLWVLWGVSVIKSITRIISFNAAKHAYGADNTRRVALFMENEHNLSEGADLNPRSMLGYKYLLQGDSKLHRENLTGYEVKLIINDNSRNNNVVTIEDVWQCKGSLMNDKLRDMCLSFALFKLLKRRFEVVPIAEARQPKTRDFVLHGLLENFERTIEVVEMELRFLRDLFYSSTPPTFGIWLLVADFTVFSMIGMIFWYGISTLIHYHIPHDDQHNIIHGKDFDRYITFVILVFVVIMMICEVLFSFFSKWAKVIFVCRYVKYYNGKDEKNKRPLSWAIRLFTRVLLALVSRVHPLPYPIVTLGQYSLLENFKLSGPSLLYTLTLGLCGKVKPARKVKHVSLDRSMKEITLGSLKKLLELDALELTNGTLTLSECGLLPQLDWALGNQSVGHTHIHTIMIWHIATSFCELDPSKDDKTKPYESVAVNLSNYCAYLVYYAPELLPVNTIKTEYILSQILEDTKYYFGKTEKKKIYEKMAEIGIEEEPATTIIKMGARLGKQLTELIKDHRKRWQILAEFWGELTLFMAPSNNSIAHAKKLPGRGEFITYLWALLTHAGMLDRPHHDSQGAGSSV